MLIANPYCKTGSRLEPVFHMWGKFPSGNIEWLQSASLLYTIAETGNEA